MSDMKKTYNWWDVVSRPHITAVDRLIEDFGESCIVWYDYAGYYCTLAQQCWCMILSVHLSVRHVPVLYQNGDLLNDTISSDSEWPKPRFQGHRVTIHRCPQHSVCAAVVISKFLVLYNQVFRAFSVLAVLIALSQKAMCYEQKWQCFRDSWSPPAEKDCCAFGEASRLRQHCSSGHCELRHMCSSSHGVWSSVKWCW